VPGRSQRAEFDLERRGAADFGRSAECFAAARQFDNGHGQAFIGAIRKKSETSGNREWGETVSVSEAIVLKTGIFNSSSRGH